MEEEGAGEPGGYHIEGSAALPDAVRVDHVEDATEDAPVCKEKSKVLKSTEYRPAGPLACASRESEPSEGTAVRGHLKLCT